ncbi:MAG: LysR substrate-binding domain-containing protein, partial [Roseobacter sp.]
MPLTLRWTEVLNEPLALLIPPGNEASTLEEVLHSVPYVRYQTRVPLARQIDTEIARFGVEPAQIITVNTMAAVIGCVQAGLGFAVVPLITLQDIAPGKPRWQPFGAPPIYRRLGLVHSPHSNRSEVLSTLSK